MQNGKVVTVLQASDVHILTSEVAVQRSRGLGHCLQPVEGSDCCLVNGPAVDVGKHLHTDGQACMRMDV